MLLCVQYCSVFLFHTRARCHSMTCHLLFLSCPQSFKENINTYVTVRNQMRTKIITMHIIRKITNSVIVGVFASSGVDRGIESRSDQTKYYDIGMCCFSEKYTTPCALQQEENPFGSESGRILEKRHVYL